MKNMILVSRKMSNSEIISFARLSETEIEDFDRYSRIPMKLVNYDSESGSIPIRVKNVVDVGPRNNTSNVDIVEVYIEDRDYLDAILYKFSDSLKVEIKTVNVSYLFDYYKNYMSIDQIISFIFTVADAKVYSKTNTVAKRAKYYRDFITNLKEVMRVFLTRIETNPLLPEALRLKLCEFSVTKADTKINSSMFSQAYIKEQDKILLVGYKYGIRANNGSNIIRKIFALEPFLYRVLNYIVDFAPRLQVNPLYLEIIRLFDPRLVSHMSLTMMLFEIYKFDDKDIPVSEIANIFLNKLIEKSIVELNSNLTNEDLLLLSKMRDRLMTEYGHSPAIIDVSISSELKSDIEFSKLVSCIPIPVLLQMTHYIVG